MIIDIIGKKDKSREDLRVSFFQFGDLTTKKRRSM
jgi:hypothetical protein